MDTDTCVHGSVARNACAPYCLCSNSSFDCIAARQAARPLPFEEMLLVYTSCRQGCGSCIESLRDYLKAAGLYVSA